MIAVDGPGEEQLSCSGCQRSLRRINKVEKLPVVVWTEHVIGCSVDIYSRSCDNRKQRGRRSRRRIITTSWLTDLERRSRSFMVCTATSLSLSRVMEIIRSWDKITHEHKEHFSLYHQHLHFGFMDSYQTQFQQQKAKNVKRQILNVALPLNEYVLFCFAAPCWLLYLDAVLSRSGYLEAAGEQVQFREKQRVFVQTLQT